MSIVANLVDLSSLSTMGSAGFLVIFAAVNGANARLATATGSRRWLPLTGALLCLAALGTLLWQTAQTNPGRIWILVVITAAAFAIELVFRLVSGRKLNLHKARD